MIDGDELEAVDEQRLLELVGDAQLVAAVPRPQLIAADANVLVGIRAGSESPGATQSPISPPPMKSVTNSKRAPFQVKRYGQDEGLRSSSVIGERSRARPARLPAASRPAAMPDGQRTRTTSAAVARAEPEEEIGRRDRRRRPRTSRALAQAAGANLDLRPDAAAIADACRRAARATTRLRLPPSFRHTRNAPVASRGRRVGVAVAVEIADRRRPETAGDCRRGASARVRHVPSRRPSGRRCSGRLARRAADRRNRSSRPSLS